MLMNGGRGAVGGLVKFLFSRDPYNEAVKIHRGHREAVLQSRNTDASDRAVVFEVIRLCQLAIDRNPAHSSAYIMLADTYYTAHILSESEEGKDYFLVYAAAVLRQWARVPEGLEWFKVVSGRARGSDAEIYHGVLAKIYDDVTDRFISPAEIAADPSGQILLDAIDSIRAQFINDALSPAELPTMRRFLFG